MRLLVLALRPKALECMVDNEEPSLYRHHCSFSVLIWIQRNLNYFPKVDEAEANRIESSINSNRRLLIFLFIVKIMSHKDDVIGGKMLTYA